MCHTDLELRVLPPLLSFRPTLLAVTATMSGQIDLLAHCLLAKIHYGNFSTIRTLVKQFSPKACLSSLGSSSYLYLSALNGPKQLLWQLLTLLSSLFTAKILDTVIHVAINSSAILYYTNCLLFVILYQIPYVIDY